MIEQSTFPIMVQNHLEKTRRIEARASPLQKVLVLYQPNISLDVLI